MALFPFAVIAVVTASCSGNGVTPHSISQAVGESGNTTATRLTPIQAAVVAQIPTQATVSSEVMRFAQRLIAENPSLAGRQIVQVASSWQVTPTTDLRKRDDTPDTTTSFACESGGPYYDGWVSNPAPAGGTGYAPPNCDSGSNLGPFRGVYSDYTTAIHGRSAAQGWIVLPDSSATMPTVAGYGQGYIYIEAWPHPNTQNAEGGYQYNAGANTYTPYVSGPFTLLANYSIPPRSEVTVWEGAVDSYDSDTVTYGTNKGATCASVGGCAGTYFAIILPSKIYLDTVRIADSGMNAQDTTCCIFRKMTSIGVATGQMFVGPSPPPGVPSSWSFGPVQWSQSFTEHYDPTVSPSPGATPNDDVADGNGKTAGWRIGTVSDLNPLDTAGYETFPNWPAHPFVSVNWTNAEVETDTIYVPATHPGSC